MVFPNPASESFTLTSDTSANKILIGSNQGKTMVEANDPGKIFHVDTSHFPSRVYFIGATYENKQTFLKVVATH